MNGHADRTRLVGERTGDRLANPPRGVRRELVALAPVELLGRTDEADRPLLDQVEERKALVAVALRDRDDETKIRLDHLLFGTVVAALDALGDLDLLRGRQQIDLAHVLEEDLQRVGRVLRDARFLHLLRSLLECGEEVSAGLGFELVERRRLLVVFDDGRHELVREFRRLNFLGAHRPPSYVP